MRAAIFDTSKVLGVNVLALIVTFTSVIEVIKYLGVVIGVSYAIWKWVTDWIDRRERKRK